MGADQSTEVNTDPYPQQEVKATANLTSVSFKINGELFTVDATSKDVNAKCRLVDFIRDTAQLKGTKYMCREGGCGACVVSVTTKDSAGQNVIRSVNSCLIPLLSCDGWEISTIESLGNKKVGYHAIQKQMAKLGGSQCGFCTGGMIMHMYSALQDKNNLKAKELEDSLDGNICRCTGYRPILDAFKSFASDVPKQACSNSDIEDLPKLCPLTLQPCSNEFELIQHDTTKLFHLSNTNEVWIKATTIPDVFTAIQQFITTGKRDYRIVAGNTSTGIYKNEGPYSAYIDILNIPSLSTITISPTEIVFGSCVTLSKAIAELKSAAATIDGFTYAGGICQHIKRIANTSVRNVGTLAGNLMLKQKHNEFPSDLFITLATVDAQLKIATDATAFKMISIPDLLNEDMSGKLILSIHLKPYSKDNYYYRSYKISPRYQNAHAIVNAGFLFKIDKSGNDFKILEKPTIVFGGIKPKFTHATATETYLNGKSINKNDIIQEAMKTLANEIVPETGTLLETLEYRKLLTQSLLYKTILSILSTSAKTELQSGGRNIRRNLMSGKQDYDTDQKEWPVNQPTPKIEANAQCAGEAEYINDIHPQPNELVGILVLSTVGNADLKGVNATEALKDPNVIAFVQAKDIPGVNNYFPGNTAEEIFAKDKVGYAGQPIGMVVAKNEIAGRNAAALVAVTYDNIKKPIVTIQEAIKKALIEIKNVAADPPTPTPETVKIKGAFEIGSQYHFHMENQICIAKPREDGMDIFSSTQWMDFTQDAIAGALGIPANDINMQVRRIGGAYGAKITRAAFPAAACAVAAYVVNAPVRLNLDLQTNMEMIGKRPPYLMNYEVDVNKDTGKISSLKATAYCATGINSNEEKANFLKFTIANCYDSTGWDITPVNLITNTASHTWCRAPSTTQGLAFIENIMEHIAFTLKKDPIEIRKANMNTSYTHHTPGPTIKELMFCGESAVDEYFLNQQQKITVQDDPTPPTPQEHILLKMITEAKTTSEFDNRVKLIEEFNKDNRWKKRGIAIVPQKYGLDYGGSGFAIFVSIYKTDGSVAISTGGVECGQGLNTKVVQTVAKQFGIVVEKIRVKPTNNFTSPNCDSTGGSSSSELCCYAAIQACQILINRMKPVKDKFKTEPAWGELISLCFKVGLDLTASYLYTKNDPVFGYDIWAVNITEVEIDVLTGEYKISRVDLLEDTGVSINPEIDVGQIEGALVHGLGMWTTEKLVYDPTSGQLLTNGTWEYKPPEPRDIPEDLRITLLKNAPNPLGVLRSKATGEPATCTSVTVVFALRNAIAAARKDAGNTDWFQLDSPVGIGDIARLCLTASSQFNVVA